MMELNIVWKGRIQHFDFEYWNAGGGSCDIFNCADEIYNSEYVYMSRAFFEEILLKSFTLKVDKFLSGTVDGQYTIVTDDYRIP